MKTKILKFLLFAAIIAFAFYHLRDRFKDIVGLKDLIKNVNYFWLGVAVIGELGGWLFDGLLSQFLVKITGKTVRLIDSFRIAIINVFAAQILPVGQAGATIMAISFYKKMGVKNHALVFLTVFWAVLTSLALLIIFLISWFFLPLHPRFFPKMHYWLWLFVPPMIWIIYKFVIPYIEKRFGKLNLREGLIGNSKKISQNPGAFAICIFSSLGYYISLSLVLYGSLHAFGSTITLPVAIFALTAAQVVKALSLIPGGLGAVESILLLLLTDFRIPFPIVFAGTMLYRVIDFWIPLVTGSIFYFILTRNKRTFGKES